MSAGGRSSPNLIDHEGTRFHPPEALDRRGFLLTATALTATATALTAAKGTTRDWAGKTPTRYPEPDASARSAFAKYKLGNTPIRRLYTNPDMLWAEGPAWNGVAVIATGDIPNNVQLRWLEEDGHVRRFPSSQRQQQRQHLRLAGRHFL